VIPPRGPSVQSIRGILGGKITWGVDRAGRGCGEFPSPFRNPRGFPGRLSQMWFAGGMTSMPMSKELFGEGPRDAKPAAEFSPLAWFRLMAWSVTTSSSAANRWLAAGRPEDVSARKSEHSLSHSFHRMTLSAPPAAPSFCKHLRVGYRPCHHLTIANGENSAAGFGHTGPSPKSLFDIVIYVHHHRTTSGITRNPRVFRMAAGNPHRPARRVLRPGNFSSQMPGWDCTKAQTSAGSPTP